MTHQYIRGVKYAVRRILINWDAWCPEYMTIIEYPAIPKRSAAKKATLRAVIGRFRHFRR